MSTQSQSSKQYSVLELFAWTMGGGGLTELRVSEGLNYKFNSKLCRQKKF